MAQQHYVPVSEYGVGVTPWVSCGHLAVSVARRGGVATWVHSALLIRPGLAHTEGNAVSGHVFPQV